MTAETVFSIANLAVLPVWLLLAIAPRWRVTEILAGSCVVSLAIAAVYAAGMAMSWSSAEGSMGSLAGVVQLFAQPMVALVGWLHYLAFDLFIGSWEVRNARRLGISHLYVVPCLFFTLMLGPVGLLLYFVIRWMHGQRMIPADGTAG